MQKALLYAATLPNELMKKAQDQGDFTRLLYLQERAKMLPFSLLWDEYLHRQGLENDYYEPIKKYESEILSKR